MLEITLGAMLSNLKINKDDEIIVYTESRAFKGKFIKSNPLNSGIRMEVVMKVEDKESLFDIEISVDHIIAIGMMKNDKFQIVPDSKINEDIKKSEGEQV